MATDAEVEVERLKLSLVQTLLDGLVGQPYPDGHALVERLTEIMGHSSVEGWLRNEFRKTLDRLMLGGDGEPPRLQGILPDEPHLLHLDCDTMGVSWRLECLHAPDDDGWFPRDEATSEVDGDKCWTIDWFDETDTAEIMQGFTEPVSFPAAVHCWYDDGLVIRPGASS